MQEISKKRPWWKFWDKNDQGFDPVLDRKMMRMSACVHASSILINASSRAQMNQAMTDAQKILSDHIDPTDQIYGSISMIAQVRSVATSLDNIHVKSLLSKIAQHLLDCAEVLKKSVEEYTGKPL